MMLDILNDWEQRYTEDLEPRGATASMTSYAENSPIRRAPIHTSSSGVSGAIAPLIGGFFDGFKG